MKLRSIVLTVTLLSCLACKDDDGPQVFLTINYNGDSGGPIDRWFFATDESGKVLDAIQLVAGGDLQFRAISPPPTFNLTVYNNSGGSPPVSYHFVTYAGIARGSTLRWDQTQGFPIPPPVIGNVFFNVTNCNKFTGVTVSDAYESRTGYSDFGNTVSGSIDLRQEKTNLLVSSYKSLSEPVYGWANNITTVVSPEVDFTSLTPFPKTVSVPLEGGAFLGIVDGTKGIPGFYYRMGFLTESLQQAQPNTANLGYLEGYDEYKIYINNSRTLSSYHHTATYFKRGPALPVEVILPNNTLVVSSPSFADFSCSYSAAYDYSVHRWKDNDPHQPTVYWSIYAAANTTPLITELPKAFREMYPAETYPALSLDRLVYYESAFYSHPDGYTYSQFVNLQFYNQEPTASETWSEQFTEF